MSSGIAGKWQGKVVQWRGIVSRGHASDEVYAGPARVLCSCQVAGRALGTRHDYWLSQIIGSVRLIKEDARTTGFVWNR